MHLPLRSILHHLTAVCRYPDQQGTGLDHRRPGGGKSDQLRRRPDLRLSRPGHRRGLHQLAPRPATGTDPRRDRPGGGPLRSEHLLFDGILQGETLKMRKTAPKGDAVSHQNHPLRRYTLRHTC